MELEGYNSEKQYYSIGEVAKMFNLSISNIRFWEQEFDILKPKKNKKGDRFFTKQDIENLKVIHHLLKEKGYTIEGARKKLSKKSPRSFRPYYHDRFTKEDQGLPCFIERKPG
jgi:DNA-binding transcriptional MerR regulator